MQTLVSAMQNAIAHSVMNSCNIYDSIANQNIRNRIKLDKEKAAAHYACGCDKEYADFCIRVLELRQFVEVQFGKLLSPRELDNLLLWN